VGGGGGGGVLERKMCILMFSQCLSETFPVLRRIQRDVFINAQKLSGTVPQPPTSPSCQILMKLELSRQNFEETLNINFHENPPTWIRVVPYGRTDTRIEGRTDERT